MRRNVLSSLAMRTYGLRTRTTRPGSQCDSSLGRTLYTAIIIVSRCMSSTTIMIELNLVATDTITTVRTRLSKLDLEIYALAFRNSLEIRTCPPYLQRNTHSPSATKKKYALATWPTVDDVSSQFFY